MFPYSASAWAPSLSSSSTSTRGRDFFLFTTVFAVAEDDELVVSDEERATGIEVLDCEKPSEDGLRSGSSF
jgi:hypothetical protein